MATKLQPGMTVPDFELPDENGADAHALGAPGRGSDDPVARARRALSA